MSQRYQIIDDRTLDRHRWLKRAQVMVIFTAGIGSGLWLSASRSGEALAAPPIETAQPVIAGPRLSACGNAEMGTTHLQLDCDFKSWAR